eukprot:scaffold54738_cov30-Attheya_sp.AAC.1
MIIQDSHRSKNEIGAKYIRARIQNRLKSWNGRTLQHAGAGNSTGSNRNEPARARARKTQEQREKIFTNLMLQGKLRQAIRFITEREKAGIMLPTDIDEKSGLPVIDVLHSKHPPARVPEVEDLEEYDTLPEFIRVDITDETMEKVVRCLSGAGGPGGTDAMSLHHWLLRFGSVSQCFRHVGAHLVDWMSNESPPWAAIRALMACRLLALNKWRGFVPLEWERCGDDSLPRSI